MIWYFTPYALDKKFLHEIDRCISIVPDPDDWVVLLDGDTAFLRADFGRVIDRYTKQHADTGLFTCYASRCHYQCQVPRFGDMGNDSILFHKQVADQCSTQNYGKVKEIDRRIAGHLMVIRKRTWLHIRAEVFQTAAEKQILGVDTKISNAILKAGLKIRLIRELYLLHYLRMAEGFDHKKHLE
ncbi:hypothetical protein [Sunxiuqinia sp. sy24]|uniref:hypothetical protein n=1 Tax=Sunxiuqinia sp. sy24 TaxID=3461495 RepID=UPI004045C08E